MTARNRIVLSKVRRSIAAYVVARDWKVVGMGPMTPENAHYRKQQRCSLAALIAGLALSSATLAKVS